MVFVGIEEMFFLCDASRTPLVLVALPAVTEPREELEGEGDVGSLTFLSLL